MKYIRRTLAALTAAAALVLTGCSALLERDYVSVTPHSFAPTAEGDPSVLRADSYQELVNALIYLVNAGAQEGTIRLYLDPEELEGDLESACLEVVQEDPLGAYAVEHIKYRVTSLVTYEEARVSLTYRRTPEQISSIVQATGVTAIRTELACPPLTPSACCASATSTETRPSSGIWPLRPITASRSAPWGCRS